MIKKPKPKAKAAKFLVASMVKLDELHPAKWNPRLLKDKKFEAMKKSIESDPEYFMVRPCLATKNGTIYAGNMRYRCAEALGWKKVPCIITDISENLAKERSIKDNGSFGEWDDGLSTMLDELEKIEVDLEQLGLDDYTMDMVTGKAKLANEEKDVTPLKSSISHECPKCGHKFA